MFYNVLQVEAVRCSGVLTEASPRPSSCRSQSRHRSAALKVPANIYLLKLRSYAPRLSPMEHVRDALREKSFHNRVFRNRDALGPT